MRLKSWRETVLNFRSQQMHDHVFNEGLLSLFVKHLAVTAVKLLMLGYSQVSVSVGSCVKLYKKKNLEWSPWFESRMPDLEHFYTLLIVFSDSKENNDLKSNTLGGKPHFHSRVWKIRRTIFALWADRHHMCPHCYGLNAPFMMILHEERNEESLHNQWPHAVLCLQFSAQPGEPVAGEPDSVIDLRLISSCRHMPGVFVCIYRLCARSRRMGTVLFWDFGSWNEASLQSSDDFFKSHFFLWLKWFAYRLLGLLPDTEGAPCISLTGGVPLHVGLWPRWLCWNSGSHGAKGWMWKHEENL